MTHSFHTPITDNCRRMADILRTSERLKKAYGVLLTPIYNGKHISGIKTFGQLVVLGFGVTAFTPAPYQRHRL